MQKEELQVDLNFSHSVVWAYRLPTLQKGLSESTNGGSGESPSSWTAITLNRKPQRALAIFTTYMNEREINT